MKSSYLNLCTDFYDLTKPEAGPKEIAFYEKILRADGGLILEAMCGSGRLLIPLLQKGLILEGVDNSSYMLQSCQKRSKEKGFDVPLYNQNLKDLLLQKKYNTIFIAIGSFQLIHDREEAFSILQKLFLALLPGGKLIIETFVPWDAIKDSIIGSTLLDHSKEISSERIANSPNNDFYIINKSLVVVYFKDQIEKSQTRYEKWVYGKFNHAEEEEYTVRWYHRFEMELLLEKAGFSSINIIDESFEQNEQAIIYVASK
jgi:SAM-dependent methyltransferase